MDERKTSHVCVPSGNQSGVLTLISDSLPCLLFVKLQGIAGAKTVNTIAASNNAVYNLKAAAQQSLDTYGVAIVTILTY